MMLSKVTLIVLLIQTVRCLLAIISDPDPDPATDLTPDEASLVAQSFLEAGLGGFSILRIQYDDEDIDSCNLIRTSTYEVQLKSTGNVYEISSESKIKNAENCRRKYKLMQALSQGGITRVRGLGKKANDLLEWKDMFLEQFQEEMSSIAQEDYRIVSANHSVTFTGEDGAEFDTELIELLVQVMITGKQYMVNLEGRLEFFGPVIPRRKSLPPKVLLSLLGGGSFSSIKRKS